jgi:glucose-1-phosphate thymidylyltransferase
MLSCAQGFFIWSCRYRYADTLIRADFELDPQADAIWVKQVDQPEAFGVVKLNATNDIIELVEKPTTL